MSEPEEKTVPQSHAFAALDVLRITKDQLELAENEIRYLRELLLNIETTLQDRYPPPKIQHLIHQERRRDNQYRFLLHTTNRERG